jgi:hypothetical protein
MKSRVSSHWVRCGIAVVIFFAAQANASQTASPTSAHSNVAALEQRYPGITVVVDKVKSAIESRNYTLLKPYIQKESYERPISWHTMKSHEPEELSFDSVVYRLDKISSGAKLRLTGKVRSRDIPSQVYIETQGWEGTLSHLVFLFHYEKDTKQWFWIGIDEGPLK